MCNLEYSSLLRPGFTQFHVHALLGLLSRSPSQHLCAIPAIPSEVYTDPTRTTTSIAEIQLSSFYFCNCIQPSSSSPPSSSSSSSSPPPPPSSSSSSSRSLHNRSIIIESLSNHRSIITISSNSIIIIIIIIVVIIVIIIIIIIIIIINVATVDTILQCSTSFATG